MSAKISITVDEEKYLFDKLEDIPTYIRTSLIWTVFVYDSDGEFEEDDDEEESKAHDVRSRIQRDVIIMLGSLLPPLPEDESLQFQQFFPIPPFRIDYRNHPHLDLLTPELQDVLIETCFHHFLRHCESDVNDLWGNELRALTKLSYYARPEVLDEIFSDEDNLGILMELLYSPDIKMMVLGTAYVFIILEKQCTSLKKRLLEKDVVRHISNLQKINETKDKYQLEARHWISRRATLICERHFERPVLNGTLCDVRDDAKQTTKLFKEESHVEAIKQLIKDITTPGYETYWKILSSGIIDSLLSYFLPSNKKEGFNRARMFVEIILSQNEVNSKEKDELKEVSKNVEVFCKMVKSLVKCLEIILQRLDKDPARQADMNMCQHMIEDTCYSSYCIATHHNEFCETESGDIKKVNGQIEIIENVMIMTGVNELEMQTNVETLRDSCPVIHKEEDYYSYCNLVKVGQILNVLHSINRQWPTLMKVNDNKPLVEARKFISKFIRTISYRHEPWFYWKLVKKCPFLVFYRRRVRLFLQYEMGVQFVMNNDKRNPIHEQHVHINYFANENNVVEDIEDIEEDDDDDDDDHDDDDHDDDDVANENNSIENNEGNDDDDDDEDDDDDDDDDKKDDDDDDDDENNTMVCKKDELWCEYLRSEYSKGPARWYELSKLDHSLFVTYVVSRKNILENIKNILSMNPNYKAYWEFTFLNESGSGRGLSREFYTSFSKNIKKNCIQHWLGSPANDGGPHKRHEFTSSGLFPSPLTSLIAKETEDTRTYFTVLGKMLAKSLVDLQILDIPFNRVLLKYLLSTHYGKMYLEVEDLKCIIPMQSDFIHQLIDVIEEKQHIKSKYSQNPQALDEAINGLTLGGRSFEDWCLNFTLPLFPEIEMKEGGADTLLSPHNVEEYLSLMMYWFLVKGPKRIFQIIKDGFDAVVPSSFLKLFYVEELESILCPNEFKPWTISFLEKHMHQCVDKKCKQVKYLLEVLSSFNSKEQQMYVQFVTAYPKIPPGRLETFIESILLDVVKVKNPDHHLPTSSTCSNFLKIPNYSSVKVTRRNLLRAIREGGN